MRAREVAASRHGGDARNTSLTGPADRTLHTEVAGSAPRERRLAVVGVAVAMLLGCWMRATWAEARLPWDYHWDEITNVGVGEEMTAQAAIDPGFYNYPALIFLAQSAVLGPAMAFTEYEPDVERILEPQTDASARVAEPGLLRALRWAAGVIPGIATIALAAAIAWVAARRAWVASVSAVLVAISAIDLRFGIFVTPDAITGTAAALAAFGAAVVTIRPSRHFYLMSGAAIGLAGAAKYNGVAAAIGLVAAHVISHRRPWAERRLLLEAAAIATLTFCIMNLGAILHPGEFIRGVGSEATHYSTGHFGNQGSSPLFNAGWLWRSFGLALPIAGCSLLSASDRARRIAIVLLAQAGGYYLFISLFPVRFARNLLPISGPLAAAAALGAMALVHRSRELCSPAQGRTVRVAAGATVAIALLVIPVQSARHTMTLATQDPWSEAQAWLEINIPEGATVAVENRAPVIDENRYDVVVTTLLGGRDIAWYQRRGVDYVIGVSETFRPFLDSPDAHPDNTAAYRLLLAPECVVKEFEGADQRLLVARLGPC